MNLAEIRDLFIKRSGRYDLITEDGQDNGANFFIQSGCRFLDRRSDIRRNQEASTVWQVGRDGLLHLRDCWMIKDVLLFDSDGWKPLSKLNSKNATRSLFLRSSTPRFYTIQTTRYAPVTKRTPSALVMVPASAFVQQDMASTAMLLELSPKPAESITVEVRGNFYSPLLEHDGDTNPWSENFPDTLIKAALYQLEIFYRNTEGANDWLVSIQLDLTDAEQMEVFSDIQNKDVMGL